MMKRRKQDASTVIWQMKPDIKSQSGLCSGFIMAVKKHKGQSDSYGEISFFFLHVVSGEARCHNPL